MSQEPYGDIPLFRELQKLLSSSQGSVNTELARQIARSIAVDGSLEAPLDQGISDAYGRAVIDAQQVLTGYTRLFAGELATADAVTRMGWVDRTIDGWMWLFDAFSERFGKVMSDHGSETPSGVEAVLGQIAPLMMGFQVGTLLGHLAREVLFRNELPVPRRDEGHLFIVAPNVTSIANDYGLDRVDLISWLALRDTARHIVLAAHPWVDSYFRSALGEIIGSIEIDLSDIERRVIEMQAGDLSALQEMQQSLPILETPRHRAALERLRAFFAVFEGYASLASRAVAAELVTTASKIDEGVTRFNTEPLSGRETLGTVLGISLDRATTEAGETFCKAVVSLRGIDALNTVWSAADNLPSGAEIKDPFSWME
ncbi:MAG: zinc-dependent metalloprotease, partial [Actinomycetota bacterium]